MRSRTLLSVTPESTALAATPTRIPSIVAYILALSSAAHRSAAEVAAVIRRQAVMVGFRRDICLGGLVIGMACLPIMGCRSY